MRRLTFVTFLALVIASASKAQQFDVFIQGQAPADMADEDVRFHMWRSKMEPVVRAEFSLANRVCDLKADQRKKMAAALGSLLDSESEKAAQIKPPKNVPNVRGGRVVMAQAQQGGIKRDALIVQVQHVIEPMLDDKQQLSYQQELLSRSNFRRETIVDNIVSTLDKRLVLSSEQAVAVREALLSDDWVDKSPPPLHAFLQSAQYIPQIPDKCVMPHLSKSQLTIYKGIQKVSWGQNDWEDNFGFGQALKPIDDVELPPAVEQIPAKEEKQPDETGEEEPDSP
ncbi:hypothetical protein [Bythopirellula polymerisocia]|uniref:Peptidylprolyl isomerase n=1 Tax=Bythopirellula polymerisocia TaxID=2528003 RepID=A0A5C6CRE1_9BACT|nr:hypothetical protein [Bythopirellula polymerisocia]TWU26011.1 hypothetical protein Pla144_32280 [Bythopirellula polymerisocia]